MADEVTNTEVVAPTAEELAAIEAAKVAAPEAKPEPVVTPPSSVVEKIDSTEEDGVVVYNETGDPGLDVALGFVGQLGIAGDDPAMVAAANGNFSLIEAKMAALGDKARGYPQMLALAKDAYQRSADKATETSKAVDAAVMSVVKTTENWEAIKVWSAANATPEEKAEINRMIDGGPVQARAAAMLLLDAYTQAKGTVVNPANPAANASGQAPSNANTPLNAREYHTAVSDLHRKLGTRMEASPEYAALRRRLR